MHECWRLLIAAHWPRLHDLLHADMLYRTQVLGDYGLERVLADLDPRVHWTGRSLVIDMPDNARHQLGGSGLLLMPSAFIWPDVVAIVDPPARPAVVYPARGIAELWQPAHTGHFDALGRLLGRTRAALLESLAEPASTHTLARRHGLAPSTVSEHLAVLHEAGAGHPAAAPARGPVRADPARHGTGARRPGWPPARAAAGGPAPRIAPA